MRMLLRLFGRRKWKAEFWKTMTNSSGEAIDMFVLCHDPIVSCAVPHGDDETISFIQDALQRAERRR